MKNPDDYLWDPGAEPDGDVAELERALAPHRWSTEADLPPLPARTRAAPLRRLVALAAGVLVVGLVARLLVPRPDGPSYPYHVLRGAPEVEGEPARATGVLRAGQRLVCDAAAAARVEVGDIGSVELGPGSRLEVQRPDEGAEGAEHLLYLERGTLTASIFAAPRLFQVGTPSGIAVDLGCIYTATVEDDGATRLAVDAGFVSFEAEGRRVLVPADASCRAWPRRGPGTPAWDHKDDAWRQAVDRLDGLQGDGGEPGDALALLLATDDPDDSLTLWHLLDHGDAAVREPVFERLVALAPPPGDVSTAACRAGDREALEAWRRSFGWSW